uniref:Cadherin domain-containing protein n=1 Tax=Latimeria chalumnae TaxID=7897 RepID=H3BE38_LATCH
SGIITVAKKLEQLIQERYTLTVKATDQGFPQLSDVTTVNVQIKVSDYTPPRFSAKEYFTEISEAAAIGSPVIMAVAISQSAVTYEIKGGNEDDAFLVNSFSGVISTQKALDFESISFYELTVRATNMAGLFSEAMVFLYLVDENDNAPVFLSSDYTGKISESAPVGSMVMDKNNIPLVIQATDADESSSALLVYQILEPEARKYFRIDASMGTLTTARIIDYESIPVFSFTVQVHDNGFPSLFAPMPAKVTVLVTNVNDSPPKFAQPTYYASVYLPAYQGTKVISMKAEDADSNVTYSIVEGNLDDAFIIHPKAGVISTTGFPFDHEEQDVYNVAVEVRDLRNPPRRAYTNIKVFVEDVNDNAPEFQNLPYYTTVQDDAEPGDVLFQVFANDKDTGDNAAITYSLVDNHGYFRIDPFLGDISLWKPFDFEALNKYILKVKATDGGYPPLHSEAEVLVIVRNKSNPLFQSLYYTVKVPENIPQYTAILHVQARSPEGFRLIYNIAEEELLKLFNINFKTGVLSVIGQLDYESQTKHAFTVRATDTVLGFFSEAIVEVEVEDINDNPPVFTKMVYTVLVEEGLPAGTSVIQLEASDEDSGRNKVISYHMLDNESDSSSFFAIDATSGTVITEQELDYEQTHQFHLKIRAVDNGVPPLSSEAIVIVNVSDLNDNPPKFRQPQYEAAVSEMATCGHIIVRVQAFDPDSKDANKLEYLILSGNDNRHFAINSSSGIISMSNLCRRSLNTTYDLNVSVSDGVFQRTVPVHINTTNANKYSPAFEQSIYEVELAENAKAGTKVIELAAMDPDDGPYGTVEYTIINKLAREKFSIDGNGHIVTSERLDRENSTERVIAIKVMAKDGGGKVAFCTIKIILTDENDNAPQFKASEYKISIQSNMSKGFPVVQILAYDADEGANADVTYFVDAVEEITEDVIEINPATGVISIKESLVGLENKMLSFQVKAQDGGTPQRDSLVPVQVNVVPNEVALPKFSEPLYSFSAYEDLPTGSEIGTVKAEADVPVIYSLVEGNTIESNKEKVFILDKDTGTLKVEKNVDHERTKWYQIDVMAHCTHAETEVASLVSVIIQVKDINDNQPVFEANPYQAFLMENMPAGTTVIQVTANDQDLGSNGLVTYSLEPESDDVKKLFTIDGESGWITTMKELDREVEETYRFHVVASDHGRNIKLSSSALVEVTITDENDNPPQFTLEVYRASVVEDSLPGQVVAKLRTEDADISELNRQLICYITDGDPLGQFAIDRFGDEWRVVLNSSLDREETEKYLLQVTASDGRFQATTVVEIYVLDINDNSPECQEMLYATSVSEDAQPGMFILKVSAKDPDLGSNAQVTYTLHGPGAGEFRLDPQTGELTTLALLDREQQALYSLFSKATDGGGRSCQADIVLTIQDVNDNPPRFSSSHYAVAMFDNTTVKTPVIVVLARDSDAENNNAEVEYSLVDSANGRFSIEESTGIVRLEKPLNEEEQSEFELTVQASDMGSPRSLFSLATLTVSVVDLSDYLPVFLHNEYVATIGEDVHAGTEVLSVSALTRDGVDDADIVYTVVNGNEHGRFRINAKTGTVYVNQSLDFESCHEYYLSIEGTRGASSSLSDMTMVIINVTDVNDNVPRFLHEAYSAEVSEDVPVRETILEVSADDRDGPLNNQIHYSIESGDPHQHFAIGPVSGEIQVIKRLNREEVGDPFFI